MVADAVAAQQQPGAAALASPAGRSAAAAARRCASARRLALIGLAALVVQIALGGWTSSNYAAVACPDFPTCQGACGRTRTSRMPSCCGTASINYEGGVLDNPARVAIHLTHRLGALVATLGAQPRGSVRAAPARAGRGAPARLGGAGGAWRCSCASASSMVLKSFPLWLATAHTAGAALLLLATLALLRALSAR